VNDTSRLSLPSPQAGARGLDVRGGAAGATGAADAGRPVPARPAHRPAGSPAGGGPRRRQAPAAGGPPGGLPERGQDTRV